MALISGTATRYDMQGLREKLHDTIYNIDPEDTPYMSGMGRGPKGSQTLEEWQTDTLATPDGDNAQLEVTMRRSPLPRRLSVWVRTCRSAVRR